jgi:hypothetical protein
MFCQSYSHSALLCYFRLKFDLLSPPPYLDSHRQRASLAAMGAGSQPAHPSLCCLCLDRVAMYKVARPPLMAARAPCRLHSHGAAAVRCCCAAPLPL